MKNLLYPMKMIPSFKDYIWGGSRLIFDYGKNTPVRPVAESWEISTHVDGPSRIANGNLAGSELKDILKKHPDMVGEGVKGELPILIKLIDAEQSLSLQVHPDNEYAMLNENQLGKNELWYIVDAVPGSKIIVGFKEKISQNEISERIANNTIIDVANYVNVKAGDCFEIPAGMLHAICEGTIIAEIQQSSNVTYRVYDYDRVGADGKKRELHVEKALDVINSELKTKNCGNNPEESFEGYKQIELTSWDWFNCKQLEIFKEAKLYADKKSFNALIIIDGELNLEHNGEKLFIKKGESVFVPAGMGEYNLVGNAKVILTSM